MILLPAPTPPFKSEIRVGAGNKGGTNYDRNPKSGDRDRRSGRHRQGNDAGLCWRRASGSPVSIEIVNR